MFERFDDTARSVWTAAVQLAGQLHQSYANTEHLLLALASENSQGKELLLELLKESPLGSQVPAEDLLHTFYTQVESRLTRGDDASHGRRPVTPRLKRVIDYATAIASELEESFVGAEHLLIALIREGEGIAAERLAGVGITEEGAVRAFRTLRAKARGERASEWESLLPSTQVTTPEEFCQRLFREAGISPAHYQQVLASLMGDETTLRELAAIVRAHVEECSE